MNIGDYCPESISLCVQYDILRGTIFTNIHAITLLLYSNTYLAEKQQIPISVFFCWTRPGFEPTIYRTRGEHANHYATDVVV